MSYFSSLLRQTGLPSPGRSAPRTRTKGLEVHDVRVVAPPVSSAPASHVDAAPVGIEASVSPRQMPAPETTPVQPTIRIPDPVDSPRAVPILVREESEPAHVEAQFSPLEVFATRVIQPVVKEFAARRPTEKTMAAQREETPQPAIEEIVTIPEEEARPIYLTDVREWVSAPVRKEEAKETREPEVIRSRQRVREKVHEAEEPHSENVTLSIGTIHVTVDGPAAPVAQPAPPRPAAAAPRESPFDATRLTRSFVTF